MLPDELVCCQNRTTCGSGWVSACDVGRGQRGRAAGDEGLEEGGRGAPFLQPPNLTGPLHTTIHTDFDLDPNTTTGGAGMRYLMDLLSVHGPYSTEDPQTRLVFQGYLNPQQHAPATLPPRQPNCKRTPNLVGGSSTHFMQHIHQGRGEAMLCLSLPPP